METIFPLELKALDESGTFAGVASTYGEPPDAQGDIVDPGAFARSISARPEVKLLWQHNEVIGKGTLTDTPQGLSIRGRLSLGVARAKEVYSLMQDHVIDSLSIGFSTIKSMMDDKGVRHLTEVKLFEVSLVAFPANSRAMVTSVKSMDEVKFYEALRDLSRECKSTLKVRA